MAKTTKKTKPRVKPLPEGTYNVKILPNGKLQVLGPANCGKVVVDMATEQAHWSAAGAKMPEKNETRIAKIGRLERDNAHLHEIIKEKSIAIDAARREIELHREYKDTIDRILNR